MMSRSGLIHAPKGRVRSTPEPGKRTGSEVFRGACPRSQRTAGHSHRACESEGWAAVSSRGELPCRPCVESCHGREQPLRSSTDRAAITMSRRMGRTSTFDAIRSGVGTAAVIPKEGRSKASTRSIASSRTFRTQDPTSTSSLKTAGRGRGALPASLDRGDESAEEVAREQGLSPVLHLLRSDGHHPPARG